MDFVKWLWTPQAKKAAAAAKEKALAAFRKRYPNADMSQFTTEVEFDEKQEKSNSWPARRGCKIRTRLAKRTGAEPYESPWVLEISTISLCWTIMCKTLCQLLISQIALQVLAGCSTSSKKIYVTPTEYFITKFRDMFTNSKITHKIGK